MEQITEGERVRQYVLEGLAGDRWTELAHGQSIGHKRIERFHPVEVTKVRFRVTEALAEPVIRKLAVYHVERQHRQPTGKSTGTQPLSGEFGPSIPPPPTALDSALELVSEQTRRSGTLGHPTSQANRSGPVVVYRSCVRTTGIPYHGAADRQAGRLSPAGNPPSHPGMEGCQTGFGRYSLRGQCEAPFLLHAPGRHALHEALASLLRGHRHDRPATNPARHRPQGMRASQSLAMCGRHEAVQGAGA